MGRLPQACATAAASEDSAASSGAASTRLRGSFCSTGSPGTPATRHWRGFGPTGPTRAPAARAWRLVRSAVALRTIAPGIRCCLGSALAVFVLTTGALAQAPARYVQENIVSPPFYPSCWLCVDSVDVLENKSLRVNLIVTHEGDHQNVLTFLDVSKIQLVSDSLDRVAASGKPEGQFMSDSRGGIILAPREAIKLSLKFPGFREQTKRVNLIFYYGAISGAAGFTVPNIALFGP
jgi:hypothetical protein